MTSKSYNRNTFLCRREATKCNSSRSSRPLTRSHASSSFPTNGTLITALAIVVLQLSCHGGGGGVAGMQNWVDPSTPPIARTTVGMDGRPLTLVFSDEFHDEGRSFADGHDTKWTAEDRPGVTNAGLQYYNSSHVITKEGHLAIQTTRTGAHWTEYDPNNGKEYNFSRFYQSGMVTTWNKFCFTSGVIEISFQLPGAALRGGLWPAFWMLGNLVRPNYLDSSDGVWPYSYDECGTSEQAQEIQRAQKYNKCQAGRKAGRGSPEIDIIEAQPGDFTLVYEKVDFVGNTTKRYTIDRPLMSSSLQVAPGVHRTLRPISPDFPVEGEWYPELYPMGGPAYNFEGLGDDNNETTLDESEIVPPRMINNYWYGQTINDEPEIWQDGLSCNWHHDPEFYSKQTVLRTEWQTGKHDGYVRWYFGDELIYEVTADMLKNKPGAADTIAQIPYEAMYLILNTDVSPRWGWNGCDPNDPCMAAAGLCSPYGELTCLDCSDPACLRCPDTTGWLADFCETISPMNPAEYKIDYVRVYQDMKDPSHTVGCDPKDYPTKEIIEENWEAFTFNSWIKDAPLQRVQHGGAVCVTDEDCAKSTGTEFVTNVRSNPNNLANEEKAFDEEEYLDGLLEYLSVPPQRNSSCVQGQCVCPDFEWTGPSCRAPCVGDYAKCVRDASSGVSVYDPNALFWAVFSGLGTVVFSFLFV